MTATAALPTSSSGVGRRWAQRVGFVTAPAVALALELVLWGFDPTLRGGTVVPKATVIAVITAVFATLLWRRRRPLVVFAVVWVYSVGLGLALPALQPFTAMVVALYEAARHAPTRTAVALLAAATVLVPVNTLDTPTGAPQPPIETAITSGIWLVIFGVTWALARFSYRAREEAERALTYLAGEAALAAQAERLRIARDVHDVISHSVTAIILNAAAARQRPGQDPEALTGALRTVEEAGTGAMRELRTLLGLLQDNTTPTTGRGLADVDMLVGTIRSCGVEVRVVRDGQPRPLPPSVDHAGYRVVQELLTNVAKHGGTHAQAVLTVAWAQDRLDLTVTNTVTAHAAGEGPEPSGFGLDGMRRRVVEVGGELTTSRPSPGTFCGHARLPAPPTVTGGVQ